MTTPFRYSQMYRFYRSFGEPTDDIFVHVYSANYRAMKYATSTSGALGPVTPFMVQSMQARRVPSGHELTRRIPAAHSAYGTYMVSRRDNNDKCQRLFIVRPQVHTRPTGETIVTGDHYSFHVNRGASVETRLQLHKTIYTPAPLALSTGFKGKIENFIPLCFDIPGDVSAFRDALMDSDEFKADAVFLHSLMTTPSQDQTADAVVGGGKKCRTRRAATFEEMWYVLPLHRVMVVGVRNGDGFDVTVFIYTRLRVSTPHSMFLRVQHERDVTADIARHFKRFCWNDFVHNPDDDLDDF
jgi:hypothetical protein